MKTYVKRLWSLVCLAATWIFATTFSASAQSTIATSKDHVESVRAEVQAARLASPEVILAGTALYIQQLEAERVRYSVAAKESEAQFSALAREIKGRADDLDMRDSLFRSQLTYNFFIYLLVNIVVLSGLWFSYLQFTSDRYFSRSIKVFKRQLDGLPEEAKVAVIERFRQANIPTPQVFEAGPLKITSNVIGLVILAMSLAFFYLYLDRVYTIRMEGYGLNRDAAIEKSRSSVTSPAVEAQPQKQ